jgi:hypothetical protein
VHSYLIIKKNLFFWSVSVQVLWPVNSVWQVMKVVEYESMAVKWRGTRGKLRGGPNEKYREIHLKQPRIFYDYY